MLLSRRAFASASAVVSASATLPDLFAPGTAEATTLRALGLKDLVGRSQRATVGTPVHHDSDWAWVGGARRIVTWTRILQDDDLMGEEESRDEILVMTLGGKVGDLRQKIPGEATLTLGEKAVVFASQASRSGVRRVIGMSQGLFPVDKESALLRPSRNLPHLIKARPGSGSTPPRSAVEILSGKSLKAARDLIRGAR